MRIRYLLYASYGALALAMLFVGGMALLTQYELRRVLIEVGSASEPVRSVLGRANKIIGIATVIGIGAVIGLGSYAVRLVARPLDRLTEAVEGFRTGPLDKRIDISGPTEVEGLARSLNRMTDTVSQRTVSRSYLNNILDSMAEMLFVVDEKGDIRRVNRAAKQRLGYTSQELKSMNINALFEDDEERTNAPDDSPEAFSGLQERIVQTKEGGTVPVLFSRSMVHDEMRDSQNRFVCVAQDIAKQKQVEERLRASLEEKTVLLQEVHHRVKNNLQVISSLLHLQGSNVENEAVRDLFKDSQRRIRSMALLHERLYQSETFTQMDMASYFDELTQHLFRTYGVNNAVIQRDIDVDSTTLTIDQAIPCGLIVNELVSNALEHAFPDKQGGTVRLALKTVEENVQLVVEDNGVGLPKGFAASNTDSLGLRLVRGLVQQLNGTLNTESTTGLRFIITFPQA